MLRRLRLATSHVCEGCVIFLAEFNLFQGLDPDELGIISDQTCSVASPLHHSLPGMSLDELYKSVTEPVSPSEQLIRSP